MFLDSLLQEIWSKLPLIFLVSFVSRSILSITVVTIYNIFHHIFLVSFVSRSILSITIMILNNPGINTDTLGTGHTPVTPHGVTLLSFRYSLQRLGVFLLVERLVCAGVQDMLQTL